MPVSVKICGLTEEEGLIAAVEGGADFLGMVFFEKSPRNIAPEDAADLLQFVPEEIKKVGLFVDPTDAWLDEVLGHVRLDILQLHGAEIPERCARIGLDYAVEVMKALGVSEAADLERAEAYLDHVDYLLFDAKPPQGADRPGGNAVSFDWSLLKGRDWPVPWLLAGGLTVDNLAEAVRESGASIVDVSSGVERGKGVKDPAMIRAFLDLAARI